MNALTGGPDIRFRRTVATLFLFLYVSVAAACGAASPGVPAAALTAAPSPAAETETGRESTGRSLPGVVPAASGTLNGPVDTQEKALAAVIARYPEYAGYRLPELAFPHPSGSVTDVLGAPDRLVVATRIEDGFRLQFTTGSGDCPAGCTSVRVDIFLVDSDGSVSGPFSIGDETSR